MLWRVFGMTHASRSPEPITCTPIGMIHSEHRDSEETPIQPVYARGCLGQVEVFPDYAEGLKDLEGFSHVVLLYHFHCAGDALLTVQPFLEDAPRGVFSTRHPRRPNRIGLSVVRLLRLEGNNLFVEDVDILDGTPLLDIKAYMPRFDQVEGARGGWNDRVDGEVARLRGARQRKQPQGWLRFSLMSLKFRFRDWIHPPIEILLEAGVSPGQTVLDFGCGPGAFSVAAALIVGRKAKVYAVDNNPLALAAVRRKSVKGKLDNIAAVMPSEMITLPDQGIDAAILYDVLHHLPEALKVLSELHRLIKPDGLLTVSDHHMRKADILSDIQREGLFVYCHSSAKNPGVHHFRRSGHE